MATTPAPTIGYGGAAMGVASAISGIMASKVAAYGYEAKALRSEFAAMQAVSAAKATNLKLTQSYNDIAASNAVMGAVSGRSFSSPTVLNMTRVDQEKLKWDIDFSTLSGEIGRIGEMADAAGYRSAASMTEKGGVAKGMLSAMETYTKYKQVG
jgi:hypothetical protein